MAIGPVSVKYLETSDIIFRSVEWICFVVVVEREDKNKIEFKKDFFRVCVRLYIEI